MQIIQQLKLNATGFTPTQQTCRAMEALHFVQQLGVLDFNICVSRTNREVG